MIDVLQADGDDLTLSVEGVYLVKVWLVERLQRIILVVGVAHMTLLKGSDRANVVFVMFARGAILLADRANEIAVSPCVGPIVVVVDQVVAKEAAGCHGLVLKQHRIAHANLLLEVTEGTQTFDRAFFVQVFLDIHINNHFRVVEH